MLTLFPAVAPQKDMDFIEELLGVTLQKVRLSDLQWSYLLHSLQNQLLFV